MNTITIDIRGPVGVGKTAIAGAIGALLTGYQFPVNTSSVDDIDLFLPAKAHLRAIEPRTTVVITETVEPRDIYAEVAPQLWPNTAHNLLQEAAKAVLDRAAERDVEQERSMGRCVEAFNALTGHELTERDGWLFMAVLKAARATATPTGRKDDYVDGAAYFGLAGESVLRGDA